MSDTTREGPTRRTVIASAAAAGAAWTVPVVLSASPAAAQASGCVIVEVTSTPVCTTNPQLPYAVDLAVAVTGCVGEYNITVLQGQSQVSCDAMPSGGGIFRRVFSPVPQTDVTFTVEFREGPPCTGTLFDSVDITVSTPADCTPAGAAVGEPDESLPAATFLP